MDSNDVRVWARDAAYTAVGFCVLGFQQLQVRRRELVGDLGTRVGGGGGGGGSGGGGGGAAGKAAAGRSGLQQLIRQAEAVVDPVLDGVERVLPGTARTTVQQSRTAARVLRKILL